jgi:MYXO-CTERM domain-containing protein
MAGGGGAPVSAVIPLVAMVLGLVRARRRR